ncbi:hypothetical protein AS25_04085 [Kocuria marina]|uniref:D-inositol 3-phosphate glycosyltransferase n=1 Tax=Kocuria marina TaxID=223184 RepID=A0A0B0DAI9_9MICC|nr:glycosyltransferase family 4 protein [Kocuria marina]KHE74976.1 hypothetical protein AS25_04085 [Kocuria marina]
MARILSIYPNCSKGGMTTVYRSRAAADPNSQFDFLFKNDAGGRDSFATLPNGSFRIYPEARFEAAVRYVASHSHFDEIRVTSLPELASALAQEHPGRVTYEFHSSNMAIIDKELKRLDLESIVAVQTPSRWLTAAVVRRVDAQWADKCVTVPNLVDHLTFHKEVPAADMDLGDHAVPLLWIGRFDKGKNFNDFLRVVASLPEEFVPVSIVSLESEPQRLARALLEARAYGVDQKLRTFLNLSQGHLASLYTWARDRGGVLVSTSLAESFGYSVAEALACGLPAAAYRVGGISEVPDSGTAHRLIPVGDVPALSRAVLEVSGAPVHTA